MDVMTIALTLVAILLSILAVGFGWYLSVTRPKRVPKPNMDVYIIVRPATRESSSPIKGYEGWIIPRNIGSYAAHDFRITLRVPTGEKIYETQPGYFMIETQTDECVEMIARRFEPSLGVQPIYFFATSQPEVTYWPHEDKGVVAVTRE